VPDAFRFPRLGLVALAACATAALAGCAGRAAPRPAGSVDQLSHGRTLFQAGAQPTCGFCHTLGAAETTSPLAPNLDHEMREADLRGLSDERLAEKVRQMIAQGACSDPNDATRCMPSGIFGGSDALAVASFVAICGRTPGRPGCAPAPGPLRGPTLQGEHLFQTRGCVGCHFSHDETSTGPSLIGLAGSKVRLADGSTVTADRAYLLRSIASPDSQVVLGYSPGMMSARVVPQHLSRAEIDALADYLESLG